MSDINNEIRQQFLLTEQLRSIVKVGSPVLASHVVTALNEASEVITKLITKPGNNELEIQNTLMKAFIVDVATPNLKGSAADYPESTAFKENLIKLEQIKKLIG